MNEDVVRKELADLLSKGQAHMTLKDALKGLKRANRTAVPKEGAKSVWEILEHMRLAQEDILNFTLDPKWQSPPWPQGYWPASAADLMPDGWKATVQGFESDLKEMVALAKNRSIDLTAAIPHGKGQTYLREILLVADHNAYHLAQIVTTRKLLGDWPD